MTSYNQAGVSLAKAEEVVERLRAAVESTRTERVVGAHGAFAGLFALDDERLPGCDLYVTLEPCTMCAGAISFARIRRVYYAAHDPKGGAVDNGVHFFDQPTCHHAPEVYGGIRESEAAALLKDFFEGKR